MARVEKDACITRRGKGGTEKVDGAGMIWAEFDHRTSRAGDPQVHTHVVVANRTHDEGGRWRALEGGTLRQAAKGHGQMYQALMRAGMIQETLSSEARRRRRPQRKAACPTRWHRM